MPEHTPTGGPGEFITVLHYVGYDDDHSGIISVIRALAQQRRFNCVLGVNPGFVSHRLDPLPAVEFPAIAAERIDLITWWRARAVARAVRTWLDAGPNRIFHGHSRAGLLVARWLQRQGEDRVFVSVHAFGRQRWFYRAAAKRLGPRLFWLSPAMKRYYGLSPADWSGCMPNAITPITPATARERLPAADPVVLGGAGMLVRWKGWHWVLEALARLPPAVRDRVRFHHIGTTDGSTESANYAAELSARTHALGLARHVIWAGWQPSTQSLLARVACLLVPSVREPFSMVALEALFAGVPVVAADEGGPTDFVVEGRSGWFFRSGDRSDLARCIEMIVTTDALRRVHIDPEPLRRFEAAVVAPQWLEHYRSVTTLGA